MSGMFGSTKHQKVSSLSAARGCSLHTSSLTNCLVYVNLVYSSSYCIRMMFPELFINGLSGAWCVVNAKLFIFHLFGF